MREEGILTFNEQMKNGNKAKLQVDVAGLLLTSSSSAPKLGFNQSDIVSQAGDISNAETMELRLRESAGLGLLCLGHLSNCSSLRGIEDELARGHTAVGRYYSHTDDTRQGSALEQEEKKGYRR